MSFLILRNFAMILQRFVINTPFYCRTLSSAGTAGLYPALWLIRLEIRGHLFPYPVSELQPAQQGYSDLDQQIAFGQGSSTIMVITFLPLPIPWQSLCGSQLPHRSLGTTDLEHVYTWCGNHVCQQVSPAPRSLLMHPEVCWQLLHELAARNISAIPKWLLQTHLYG